MKIEQIKEKQVKIILYNFIKIVREKSRQILKLLEDKDKLMEERKNYSKWRTRIEGVGNNGKVNSVSNTNFGNVGSYGGLSSDNYNGYSNYNYNDDKKKDKSSDSESDSDSEKEKKKKKKKGKKKKRK